MATCTQPETVEGGERRKADDSRGTRKDVVGSPEGSSVPRGSWARSYSHLRRKRSETSGQEARSRVAVGSPMASRERERRRRS